MAYRLIYHAKIVVQFIILDYILGLSFENIDLRTLEGMRRYKEIFGSYPRNQNFSQHNNISKGNPPKSLPDIDFLFSTCNERSRRLFAGFLAKTSGNGGVEKVAKQTGLDMKTVRKGKKEIDNRVQLPKSRIRKPGGGRLSKMKTDSEYNKEINRIIDNDLAGDPMCEKKWIRKTLRWMRDKMKKKGITASPSTIRNSLKSHNISLKRNKKTENTRNHPDREKQFQYLSTLKKKFLKAGNPIISTDTKKKELIGNFKNSGKTWRKDAYNVLDHDFPSSAKGKLVPYGIYDLKKNKGYVYCGISSDTSEFAVDSLCWWWKEFGQKKYPDKSEVLIFCDSGGSNGYRRRKWKWDLQTKFADRFNVSVTVCHYPSGASKYNPIEHKLFSFISLNWAGEPLISYEKAMGFIRSTHTEKGLRVEATLVENEYKKGLKVSDEQMKSINIKHAKVCSKWNYTIKPGILQNKPK